jgi:hypothetical protein
MSKITRVEQCDITVQDICAYLDSKGPQEVVGVTRNSGGCLVSNALSYKYDGAKFFVSDLSIRLARVYDSFPPKGKRLRPEVGAIVRAFDEYGRDALHPLEKDTPVTRSQAEQHLKHLLKREQASTLDEAPLLQQERESAARVYDALLQQERESVAA